MPKSGGTKEVSEVGERTVGLASHRWIICLLAVSESGCSLH